MRILLIYSLNLDDPSLIGLHKKMYMQRDAFACHGRVDLINIRFDGIYLNGARLKKFKKRPFSYLIGYYHLFFNSINSLINPSTYDLIYIRYPLALPSFINFLRHTKKLGQRNIYVEFPTYPYNHEDFNLKRWILLKLDHMLFPFTVKFVTKFVTHYSINDKKLETYFMGNGVAPINKISWKNLTANGTMEMIGVANLSKYHAYDRILFGMKKYLEGPYTQGVKFHIIGNGPEIPKIKQIVDRLNLIDHVTFYGIKSGKELDQIMERCHVAISTLGWHRVKVSSDGSLKSREYCMRGIPFVTCSDDSDIPADFPGKLNVGLSDKAIDIERLINFLRNLPSGVSEDMHLYAMKNLTWKHKIDRFMIHEKLNA